MSFHNLPVSTTSEIGIHVHGHRPRLYTVKRGPLGRLWWRVADSPRRLLLAGAPLQGAAYALHPGAAPLVGIAVLVLCGELLERVPHWSGRSPIHYLSRVTGALGINAGLLGLALLPATTAWHLLSALLLLLGDLGALRPHLPWMSTRQGAFTRLGAALALLVGTALLLPL